ncbi:MULTISPECIES: tRNA 2-selenouridine(34) synthase MnmH [unclassified Endozoicomonas]|uniref:tRNA 2-selenouridine(34) synthase MnmH n=1 Tax=unclassified Endozoicomonas TaxID=2644528 RepID=UPI002148B192|nr:MULTISPECIES: tRNA 2-selenouridine(34) synthase MnmH [unclassified Endozoicomonas]
MTQQRPDTTDYLSLFLNDAPLMDVRAPVEFSKGSFPLATNLPILDDHQRKVIGTEYKQYGQEAALSLGYELATDNVRTQRVTLWQQFAQQHPDGYLFCFRGGQRSHISQSWLAESGYPYPLVEGGYKAMRRFLIDELEQSVDDIPFMILAGKTGTGKTRLIHDIEDSIDLEGLANHRGSSFGRRYGGQPTQIDFESRLSIAMLKHRHFKPGRSVLLEDESKLIGRCGLSRAFRDKMQQSPIILLETFIKDRVEIALQEYVRDNLAEFETVYGKKEGFARFSQGLADSLYRIRKRLGGARYKALGELLSSALLQHEVHGIIDGYRPLIEELLVGYYDPMYEYQLEQKQGRILFRGNREEIRSSYPELVLN